MIKVVKDEWTPFVKELGRIPKELEFVIPRMMRDIISAMVVRAQQFTTALGLVKTGFYRDNHRIFSGRVSKVGKNFIIDFGNDAPYAGFIEDGTRAHGPKHAKYLVWTGRYGKPIFAKWVRGLRPYKVWTRAIGATSEKADAIIAKSFQKGIEKLNKRVTR